MPPRRADPDSFAASVASAAPDVGACEVDDADAERFSLVLSVAEAGASVAAFSSASSLLQATRLAAKAIPMLIEKLLRKKTCRP